MRLLASLLSAGLILLGATAATAQDPTRVVAVNYALKYFAERLLEDEAEVIFPVPQDVDPSFWRPSIADISQIQSADLILLNGAAFATWIDRVSLPRSKLVNTSAAIEDQYIFTESVTHSHGEGDSHSHENLASYLWLDPTLAIAQAEAIAAALIRRNLGTADQVESRLAALRADLEALDTDARASLAGLKDTAVIVTHPRYQYFARRYGLSVTSLEWEAGSMPTADELADLEAMVQDTGARILIWEGTPPDAATQAAAALGLQSATFTPLAHQDADRTYLDTFSAAVKAISNAGG